MTTVTEDVPSATPTLDRLIVGDGPAGLTAAIYLLCCRRKVALVDDGNCHARWITTSHNHAGFTEGICSDALLERMRIQTERYGAQPLRPTGLL